MADFYRFPHTPHLAWLGQGQPRDDKVLGPEEAAALLRGEVTVEEKVDGANVGISLDESGTLRLQNRGSYLEPGKCHSQWKPLFRWLGPRQYALGDALGDKLMLFGEWCYAVHSVRYDRLPDWLLAFDVFDREAERFWSEARRDSLLADLGVTAVPRITTGHFDAMGLRALLGPSALGHVPVEGIYVRRDEGDWLAARAKLVRPEFTQAIEEHWSRRPLEVNHLATSDTRG